MLTLLLTFVLVLGLSACKNKNINTGEGLDDTTHTHDYKSVITQPTCTDVGYNKYICSCGNSFISRITPASGHLKQNVSAKSATCTEKGWNDHVICSRCDYSTLIETPALGHNEQNVSAKSATCTEKGWNDHVICSRCDYSTLVETPALGHKAEEGEYMAPTCTEYGFSLGTFCTVCNEELPLDVKIPPLGHDYKTVESTPATCTEDGIETVVCFTCDNKVIRKTNATGHIVNSYDIEKATTCETEGEKSGYCESCSEYVTIILPANGHSIGSLCYENDYCGSQRLGYAKCTACDIVVLNFGHTYETSITYPTCNENGEKIRTCTNCGSSYSEIIESVGHISGEWILTTEATCSNPGVQTNSCITCGENLETRSINKKDHKYESFVSNSKITYTCAICFDSYEITTQSYIVINFITVLENIDCPPIAINYNSTATLPILEKDGYEFNGWYFDEECKNECTNAHIFSEDTALYASWSLLRAEGSASANNIITNADLDFTFCVKSTTILTKDNLKDYVSIEDVNGISPNLYISEINEDIYTIASNEYRLGMGYEVVTINGVTLIGTDSNQLMFVTKNENSSDVTFKDCVIFISETDVFTAYEADDGKTYFFFRKDLLHVGDIAVIRNEDEGAILAAMKVVAKGNSEGAFIYEVEPANSEDVFEECEIYFSGIIDSENFEFTANLENEIIELVEASALYAQMKYASKQYAKGVVIGNYYYEFSSMKVKPTFEKEKNTNNLIIGIEITTDFERLHTETRVVDSILSITLKVKSVFELSTTVNLSSLSNFTLVLNIDNNTTIDLYVSMGEKKESKKELSYFKELFLKAKEEGEFDELDSSYAEKSKDFVLGQVSCTFYGITFKIEVSNVFSLETVGQLGMSADIKMNVKAGLQCKNGNLSAVKSFNSQATLDFYMMGKIKVSDTIKLKASVGFLGVVNAYVDVQAGPYFEMGGVGIISISTNGGYASKMGGYIEMGITVKSSAGVNAKISYWWWGWKTKTLFDKNWTLYQNSFVIFKIGDYTITLYFEDAKEEVAIDYACGNEVKLNDIVDRNVVQQNLKTMKKSSSEMSCLYSLEGDYPYVTLTKDGVLTVSVGNLETIEIVIKIQYNDVYKIVYLTLNIKHSIIIDEAVAPSCITSGLTMGTRCSICNKIFEQQTVVKPLGHTIVIDEVVNPTCTETGLTAGAHCSICNYQTLPQTIIQALGHDEQNHPSKEAACTEIGWNSYVTCSRCSYTTYQEVAAKGHSYSTVVTEPTVSEQGYTTYTCYCGNSYISDYTLPLSASVGITYSLSSDSNYYIVSGIGTCTDTEIIIADKYNGLFVRSIGDSAFEKCQNLTNIIIPDSITSIGKYAFKNCTSLANVTIGNSVTNIGYWAFSNCSSLTSIVIPDSVTSIGDYAFYGCDSLTSVTIGNGVTNIGDYAFDGCDSLTSVTIPDSVTSIGEHAFYSCDSLTSVTIGNGVTSIGEFAFCNCPRLKTVTIGNNIKSIGYEAFNGCSSLTSVYITDIAAWCGISLYNIDSNPLRYANSLYLVENGEAKLITDLVIPNEVASIGDYAFYYCDSLTSITIPDSVTSIGYQAFNWCSSLTSVTIGNGVTSIGNHAFRSCSSLTSVTIGNSVASIGEEAFACCYKLTSITIHEDNENYKSINGNLYTKDTKKLIQYAVGKKDTSFIIPNSVVSIGSYAFAGCDNLTSVTIPNGVTSIGSHAFAGCDNLTSVTIPNSVTIIDSYSFQLCSSLTSISYDGTISEWKNTKKYIWNDYTGTYTIYCTDGEISKDGTVTRY